MTASGPAASAAPWTERYETLRQYVLEGRQRLQSQPLGLALWMAKGMAGWMRQWKELLEPVTASASALPRLRSAEPGPWQHPLTLLLAQITLQHLEPRMAL
jgi:hypothetical protein